MSNTKKKDKTVLDVHSQPIFVISNLVVIITNNIPNLTYTFETYDHSEHIDFTDPNNNTPGTTFYGYEYKGEPCLLVVIDPTQTDSNCSIQNVIAHESFHVAHRLLDHSEIYLQEGTQEVFANVVGWTTQCITKSYEKWLKKN